jgi:hypothetical protein
MIEARVGIMCTGKKTIGVGRKRLENKVCMTKIVRNSKEWKQTIHKTADRYNNLSSVQHLNTGGDGNTWVSIVLIISWMRSERSLRNEIKFAWRRC